MTPAQVPLTSILECLQGVIPSPFATCAADGMPNITYMSTVQYVDVDRVALSRQFFRKTAANLEENPAGQVLVVDPATIEQYLLDLRYLHTETEGPVFEALENHLEALAAQTGTGQVARLRGVDIHRVVSCVRLRDGLEVVRDRGLEPDALRALDEFVRHMSAPDAEHDLVGLALRALDDVFGFARTVFLVPAGDKLHVVAARGYGGAPTTSDFNVGDGLIGVAAQRRQVVCVPHLARSQVMASAVHDRAAVPREGARPIALPTTERVYSVGAVPLVANGVLTGLVYLESDKQGAFGPRNERLLRIIGHHLAATLSMPAPVAANDPRAIEITYYRADDSVFADGDYVIKGAPGRILWKLLREHVAEGRMQFTNRELRLDEDLELPPGNDNLDSRLVALRRRLQGGSSGIGLERVGRGRLALQLDRPLALTEVPTSGPMRREQAWP